jgi:hypothetical protein
MTVDVDEGKMSKRPIICGYYFSNFCGLYGSWKVNETKDLKAAETVNKESAGGNERDSKKLLDTVQNVVQMDSVIADVEQRTSISSESDMNNLDGNNNLETNSERSNCNKNCTDKGCDYVDSVGKIELIDNQNCPQKAQFSLTKTFDENSDNRTPSDDVVVTLHFKEEKTHSTYASENRNQTEVCVEISFEVSPEEPVIVSSEASSKVFKSSEASPPDNVVISSEVSLKVSSNICSRTSVISPQLRLISDNQLKSSKPAYEESFLTETHSPDFIPSNLETNSSSSLFEYDYSICNGAQAENSGEQIENFQIEHINSENELKKVPNKFRDSDKIYGPSVIKNERKKDTEKTEKGDVQINIIIDEVGTVNKEGDTTFGTCPAEELYDDDEDDDDDDLTVTMPSNLVSDQERLLAASIGYQRSLGQAAKSVPIQLQPIKQQNSCVIPTQSQSLLFHRPTVLSPPLATMPGLPQFLKQPLSRRADRTVHFRWLALPNFRFDMIYFGDKSTDSTAGTFKTV